jgi:hypothetical protein
MESCPTYGQCSRSCRPLQENRHRQAWLIFVPVAVVALVAKMATRALKIPDDAAEWTDVAVMALAVGWSAVWLYGARLAGRHGMVRFIAALVLMLAFGGLSYLAHLGLDNTDGLLSISISHGIASVVLLVGMMRSGRSCRNEFRRGKFMRRLFATMVLVALLPAVVTATLSAILGDFGSLALMIFVQMSIMCVAAATMLYLLNVPFMLLAFNSPFYGAIFHAVFCPEGPRNAAPRAAEALPVG